MRPVPLSGKPGLCRKEGCERPNATGRRKLCAECAAEVPQRDGGKDRCTKLVDGARCTKAVAAPRHDKLCRIHNPLYKEQYSLENVALDAVAQGKDPAKALAAAGASAPKAMAKQMAERPAFQERLAELMTRAGIDEADGLRAIGRALTAKKLVKLKSGDELLTQADDHEMQMEAGKFMVGIQGLAAAKDNPGGGGQTINLHIGAHIPAHKPVDLTAEVVDVGEEE